MPRSWWSAPRIRNYLLFDATGLVYLLFGFLAIRIVWSLGKGPDAWELVQKGLSNPLYIAFHLLALVSVVFVGVRFFSLFPKAQPRDTGLPMPPGPVIKVMLYGVWIAVTALFSMILAGGIF